MKGKAFADDEDSLKSKLLAGWKSNVKSYSRTKFKHWGDTEPSAFSMQKSMLKCTKI